MTLPPMVGLSASTMHPNKPLEIHSKILKNNQIWTEFLSALAFILSRTWFKSKKKA